MADSRLRVVIDAVDNSKAAMNSASERVKKLSADVGAAGRSFIALGAPLVALGALSVKTFGTFEQTMARVQAVSNATAAEFEDLNEVAREMGQTTVFTANQSAEALAFMAMAGLSAKDAIGALPSVLQLAAAGGLELANAADIITNVMAGMGLEVEELARANDVLVTAFTNTNTNLQQLGQAFKFAGPVAKAAGLTFEDTSAALAQMGNAGIQATMAGTALRGAISKLLSPSKEAEKVLDQLGISVLDSSNKMLPFVDIVRQFETVGLDAADAMTIFGLRAGPGMLALVSQGADALEELRDKMLDSGGTAQRIADVQLATLQGQFTLLKSAVEGAALELGAALMPALLDLIDILRPIVAGITDFIERNKKLSIIAVGLGVALVAVGAAMVGIGIIVPGLVTAFGLVAGAATVMWAAITGPIGLVVLALAGLVTAFILWRDKFIEIAGLVARAAEMMFLPFLIGVRKVLEVLNKFGIGFDASLISLEHWVEAGLTKAGEVIDDVGGKLRELVDDITGVTRAAGERATKGLANLATILSEAADRAEMAGRFTTTFRERLGKLATILSEAAEKQETLRMNTVAYTRAAHDATRDVGRFSSEIKAFDLVVRNSTDLIDDFGTEFLDIAHEEIPAFENALLKARTGMTDAQVALVLSKRAASALEAEIGELGRALEFMSEEGLTKWIDLLVAGNISMDQFISVWKQLKDQVDETNDSMKESIEITNSLIAATVAAVNASLAAGGGEAVPGGPIATRVRNGVTEFLIPGIGWVPAQSVAGTSAGIASMEHGGVVAGTGPKVIVAHGGETITPAGQGRGVTVVFSGNVFGFDDFEDRVVEAVNRGERRGALDVG